MAVYGEYLFAENFIAGMVILSVTGIWAGRRAHTGWIITGALLCAAYAFTIFVPFGIFAELAMKILFSFLITGIVFFGNEKIKKWKRLKAVYIRTVIIFYTVSFMAGGLAFAVLLLTDRQGAYGSGGFYIADASYLKIMIALALSYFIGRGIYGYISRRIAIDRASVDVEIKNGEKVWQGRGLIDTGNSLKEPLSGRPVHIVSSEVAEAVAADSMRYVVIPYKSMGNPCGILNGYRVDEITAGTVKRKGAVIAVSDRRFEGTYDVLLNYEMMEG